MILLCAHRDTVRPDGFPHLINGLYTGLLDNALGMFAAQAVILRNHSLQRLASSGKLGVYHADDEEFLLPLLPENLPARPDLALVVDVVSGEKYKNIDAAIENICMPNVGAGKELQEFLAAEGYTVTVKDFTGDTMDEDEAWMWREQKVPVMTVLLPIDAKASGYCNWHNTDCTCPLDRMVRFLDVLTRIICYCSEYYDGKPPQTQA